MFLFKRAERKFKEAILASGIYNNDFDSLIEQPDLYRIMYDHFFSRSGADKRTPKLLFIGYDGCRSDMPPIVADNKNAGMAQIYNGGTLWLTRTGGARKGDQPPITAPAWAAIFTGMWSDKNGVANNEAAKNKDVRTIMSRLHSGGFPAAFSYSWKNYHTHTYKDEAERYPEVFIHRENDGLVYEAMLDSINRGNAATFGILEYTDRTGHRHTYNPKGEKYRQAFFDCERCADGLIAAVKARPAYEDEDWLIIIASDHGGEGTGHNREKLTITTPFFAMNKKV